MHRDDRESGCSSRVPPSARQLRDAMGLHFKGQGHSSPHSPGSYTVMRPIRRLPQGVDSGLSPVFIPPTANKSNTLSSQIIPTFTQNLGDNNGLPANPGRQPRPSRDRPVPTSGRKRHRFWLRPLISTPVALLGRLLISVLGLPQSLPDLLSVCPSLPFCLSVVHSHQSNATRTATPAVFMCLLNLD